MNVMTKIEIPSGTEYIAKNYVDNYAGQDWEAKIISVSKWKVGVGEKHEYVASNLDIIVNDSDGYYRALLNDIDNREWQDSVVTVYTEVNGTVTQRRITQIYDWSAGVNIIIFHCTEMRSIRDQKFIPEVITEDNYPTMPPSSKGKLQAKYFGYHKTMSGSPTTAEKQKNTVRCYRVDLSGTEVYLIGKVFPAPALIWGATLSRAFLSDGTDVSGLTAFVLGADGKYYVNYTDTVEDYIDVHIVPNASYAFLTLITDVLDELGFTYDTSDITTLFDEEKERYFNRVSTTTCDFLGYVLDSEKSNDDILKEICDTAEMDYYKDDAGKIHFKAIKFDALTADKSFEPIEILKFTKLKSQSNKRENRITVFDALNPITKTFDFKNNYDEFDSQERSGIVMEKSINYPMGRYVEPYQNYTSHTAAKFRCARNRNARIPVEIEINLSDGLALNPLYLIEFSRAGNEAISEDVRLYHVRSIMHNTDDDKTTLTLWDIDDFKNYYTGAILLLQSNVPVSDTKRFLNRSLINSQTFIPVGNIRHNRGQSKFGDSAMRFPGVAGDALGGFVGTNIIDPTLMPDWGFSLWLRFDNASQAQGIFSCYLNDDNRWFAALTATDKLQFVYRVGGANLIAFESNAVITTADTWYHIVLIKSGSDWGWYLDGSQEGYLSYNVAHGMSAFFQIGERNSAGGISFPMLCWMDDFIIMLDNEIGWGLVDSEGKLAPVVGETDSYTVPTKQLSVYGVN